MTINSFFAILKNNISLLPGSRFQRDRPQPGNKTK